MDEPTESRPKPLAERMRPRSLEDFLDRDSSLSPGRILRSTLESRRLPSLILWGPPGCGKTTLARLLAESTEFRMVSHSAVSAGVKDIKTAVAQARQTWEWESRGTVLFLDEIHRFNKSQQDALLPHVEDGTLTLVGATTENPSFQVNAALLSRCQVITLPSLGEEELATLVRRALSASHGLGEWGLEIEQEAVELLVQWSDGDGRYLLNSLESVALHVARLEPGSKVISKAHLQSFSGQRALRHDRAGEEHFNLLSALHKSLRGSDPQAGCYWVMRMLEAGEDPMIIVRRMIRFASEDIGNADPNALVVAMACRDAVHMLGMPEADAAIIQLAIYLATAPKSNACYLALGEARMAVKRFGTLPVPLSIRNAPTPLMKNLGYGQGYQYPHDSEDGFVAADYLPDEIADQNFYTPSRFGFEREIEKRMSYWSKRKEEVSKNQSSKPKGHQS